tara:strand:+ start:293 stop:496 length:204 start_codon:yes stop_codon:yes gene_type:complete
MSYTSKELDEIADNINKFRIENYNGRQISSIQEAQLYRMVKDLYKISDGVHTKEAEEEYISHYNSST